MNLQEAHLIAQDVSLTLEQAYGMSKARFVLGFWAASMWPKDSHKIFSARKTISVLGSGAEKMAAYLGSTMPVFMHAYVETDELKVRPDKNFICLCNRKAHGVLSVRLDEAAFDPWPRLRELADPFSEAAACIRLGIGGFEKIHRQTLMAAMDLSSSPSLYAQACLSWAGWGALCHGFSYAEANLPVPEAVIRASKKHAPNFDGIVAYKPDWMIILSEYAGPDVRRMATTRKIPIQTLPGGEAVDFSVCEFWLSKRSKWVFDLAAELGVDYQPVPRIPMIIGS